MIREEKRFLEAAVIDAEGSFHLNYRNCNINMIPSFELCKISLKSDWEKEKRKLVNCETRHTYRA